MYDYSITLTNNNDGILCNMKSHMMTVMSYTQTISPQVGLCLNLLAVREFHGATWHWFTAIAIYCITYMMICMQNDVFHNL